MTVLVTVETVLLAFLVILVCGLLRSHAEIIRAVQSYGRALADQPEGTALSLSPTAGQPTRALGFSGETVEGKLVDYPLWQTDDRDTVLAFLTGGCQTCQGFWDAFQTEDIGLPDETRLIIVAKDRRSESRGRLRRLTPPHHDVVLSTDAWNTYRVPGSPYFVYITGKNAMVAGQGSGQSWPQVLDLLALTHEEEELAEEEGTGIYAAAATREARRAQALNAEAAVERS